MGVLSVCFLLVVGVGEKRGGGGGGGGGGVGGGGGRVGGGGGEERREDRRNVGSGCGGEKEDREAGWGWDGS